MSKRWPLLVASTAIVLIVASFIVSAETWSQWMDPVTGSLKTQSSYLGVTVEPIVRVSRLESWIRERDSEFTNQWQFIATTEYNIWGNPTLFACGKSPEIYSLRGDMLDEFVRGSTNSELERFVTEMRSGDDERQKAAVENAVSRVRSP